MLFLAQFRATEGRHMEDMEKVDQLLREALARARRERLAMLAYLLVMAIEENVAARVVHAKTLTA